MSEKVVLYYDVVSPYSYFAFELLLRYEDIWNLDIELKPAFLGGIMHLTENVPPGNNPSKARYLMTDLHRTSEYIKVPLRKTQPEHFPTNTMNAQRLLTLIYMREKNKKNNNQFLLRKISKIFWERYWGTLDYFDIGNVECLKKILLLHIQDLRSIDSSLTEAEILSFFDHLADDQVKKQLKLTTEEAVVYGAFGLPYLYFPRSSEPLGFFGSDRFPLIAFMLNKQWNGPLPNIDTKISKL